MDIPIAANVLGTTGAVCWSVQLIPQIIINYRRHHTTGLQSSMMLLWALAGIPLGVYNIVSDFNIALRIQPQILTFLSLVTWGQCMYYGKKWSKTKVVAWTTSLNLIFGAVEVGLVFALKLAEKRNSQWTLTMMAVLSAILLSAGVLRHYWDIYKMRTVRGISFLFVFIDALGDLTSLLSLVFEHELDILGMVIYGSELVLWTGIIACGGYYNFRPWVRKFLKRHRGSNSGSSQDVASMEGPRGWSSALPDVELSELQIEVNRSAVSSSVFRTASLEASRT